MADLRLKICQEGVDSHDEQSDITCNGDTGLFPEAIDILNAKFRRGEIQTISLTGKRNHREMITPLQYTVSNTGLRKVVRKGNVATVDGLTFSTSYYVGQAIIVVAGNPVSIKITPDLTDEARDYLLRYACGLYVPSRLTSNASTGRDSSLWLLLLMWRCAFERAIRHGSIPRNYVQEEKNLRFFRGRLDVIRQIQTNLTDQSRFYCQYAPLSMDITINRVIRYVYKLISDAEGIDKCLFRSLAEHDDMLASFGVGNTPVSPEQIDRICYHRMNIMYRPLMQLSKALIRNFGASDYKSSQESMSYFVDWTEIWENYLLKVMQKHIPEFSFVSPNDLSQNIPLLECGRRIRPDFLVYKKDKLVAVMDAKYKKYNCIGPTGDSGISRDDLYQMTTYLYHYLRNGEKLLGIFLARGITDDESEFVNGHAKILLRNLTIPNDIGSIKDVEEAFSQKIKVALSGLL